MGGAAGQAGHIGDAEAELGSAGGEGGGAVGLGDLPEHVGPLGIAGQKYDVGSC